MSRDVKWGRKASVALIVITGWALPADAQVRETNSFSAINAMVPDGNASGLSDVRVISSSISELASVRVKLKITGEFNGDLYGYLRQITPHATNFCILLNRPGRTASDSFGYDDMGLDVTFDDAAPQGDIHVYRNVVTPVFGSPLTGTWEPDGRNVLPHSVTDDSPRTATLSAFAGSPAAGEWTLFLADIESGGTNMLVSWSLEFVGTGAPSLTWPAPADLIYGTALSSTELNATSSVAGTFTYNPPAGTILNAGAHTLTVTFTPQDPVSYETATTNVSITVLPKALTIAANDAATIYGAPLPPFAASYSGFVNGDTPASLDSPVTFATSATQNSDAGTYAISPGGASDANYAITFVEGTLTISRANSTGTLATSANPALPGQQVTFTYTVGPVAPSTAIPAGNVVFRIGDTSTSVPLVNGTASLNTSSLPVGSSMVAAEFASTANFIGTTNRLIPDQIINTPPIAGTDEMFRSLPNGAKVRISTLLRNDSDADGHAINFVSASATTSSGGTITRENDWLHYTAPAGFTNGDSFTYTVQDPFGHSATGVVNIRISEHGRSPNLRIIAIGDGSFSIRFDGVPNLEYRIEYSEDPGGATWQTLQTRTADDTGRFEIIDRPAVGSPMRVYRSVTP